MISVAAILANGNSSHLTKEEIEARQKKEEELKKLGTDKIRPPKWLGKEAKKIFKDIVTELEPLGLLANVDIHTLAVLADCMSKYIECTIKLHTEELIQSFTNKYEEEYHTENPIVRTQLKYAEMVKKYASEFGLTPSARLKIINQNTPGLDEEEQDFDEDFGNV